MKRASALGLHKRWYERHRDEKLAYCLKRAKRLNPAHGLSRAISRARRGDISLDELHAEFGRALALIGEGRDV